MPEHPPAELAAMRVSYQRGDLTETDVAADPVTQFGRWFDDVRALGLAEPNAMVLATVGADGAPSVRTVLLKGVDAAGFRFFTNRESRKGRELQADPRAALCFPWHAVERQVTVTGAAEPLPDAEAAAYFASRPRESQLGATASRQSTVVADRTELDARLTEVEAAFPSGTPVPKPDFWGGWLVRPATVEFWQGRTGRLHDRLRYRLEGGRWVLERLSP